MSLILIRWQVITFQVSVIIFCIHGCVYKWLHTNICVDTYLFIPYIDGLSLENHKKLADTKAQLSLEMKLLIFLKHCINKLNVSSWSIDENDWCNSDHDSLLPLCNCHYVLSSVPFLRMCRRYHLHVRSSSKLFVWTSCPQVVVLSWEIVEPLKDGAKLEEVSSK